MWEEMERVDGTVLIQTGVFFRSFCSSFLILTCKTPCAIVLDYIRHISCNSGIHVEKVYTDFISGE